MVSQAHVDQGKQRRQQMLEFIRSFIEQNGYSPSIAEIGKGVGIASPNSTRSHLERMQDEGLITMRPRTARSIRVVE